MLCGEIRVLSVESFRVIRVIREIRGCKIRGCKVRGCKIRGCITCAVEALTQRSPLILIRDWLPVLLWMAAIFWGSSRSTLPGPWGSREPWSNALGMATHMAEYAILAALTYRALRQHASRFTVRPAPDGTFHASLFTRPNLALRPRRRVAPNLRPWPPV